jgi:phosphoglycerate dehydrogenase-like enzyme
VPATSQKVLFIAHPAARDPWYRDFIDQVPGDQEVILYDPEKPFEPQVSGAAVVVEVGGEVATKDMIRAAAKAGVRLWQIMGTGLDHVDIAEFRGCGLDLANTPGEASAVALAEHALFLMLCLYKQIGVCAANVGSGRFYVPVNRELSGATLLIVGLGASGLALARRAADMGMQVLGVEARPLSADQAAAAGVDRVVPPGRIRELVPLADVVSLHAPLTDGTRHLIGADLIGLMRQGAVVVNVARGELIDESALAQALRDGRLAGAGLDVFGQEPLPASSPLRHLDNVVLTPHVAGATDGTSRRRAWMAASNVTRVGRGETPAYLVSEEPFLRTSGGACAVSGDAG